MPMPVRRSSSATVEGQPRLHKTLSQPAPFSHSRRKALRTVTAIKVVIVSRKEPGNSCMLVVKIKWPGLVATVVQDGLTRDPLASASCV